MTNHGNPNPSEPAAPPKRSGWLNIIAAGLFLVLGVWMVGQFLPILYGVLFPPSPPRPDNTTELSRDTTAYGVDTIVYSTADDGCRLTRYYQSQGATCRIAPSVCDSGFVQLEQPRQGSQVARCTADVPFSIFTMRYRAEIAAGYGDDAPTRLRLEREIFWSGQPGPAPDFNATPIP